MNDVLRRMVSRLTIRQLRVVVAVAEHGSLVSAAKNLQITQPAISKALQETETLLGVEMFSRTNRGVLPTAFGEALSAHGRSIFSQLRRASEEIKDLKEGRGGRVVVGTLLAASAELLPRALAMLRAERPNIAISVVEGTNDHLLPGLRLGKVDLVVGRLDGESDTSGLVEERLLTDMACVVVRAGDPLLQRPVQSLAELLNRSWVLPRHETMLRRRIDAAFRRENVEPPACAIDSVSQLTNRRLVIDEGYLTIWPWLLAHREAQDGNVSILPMRLLETRGEVGVLTRAEPNSPTVDASLQALRAAAATIDPCPFL